MPLFEGHKDKGVARLFIEMPDDQKVRTVWKWPDQQIIQHSEVNVDLDFQAVFTNLGSVIGVLGPGRHQLDQGASLTLGWLVDRLTADAYYDAELYFVTTRDIVDQEFGGPVDNLTDGPTGLVVSLRVFGDLAFKVTDPTALLSRLTGTSGTVDFDGTISTWVRDQTLAAIRVVLPDLVAQHGVLAMGQLQAATADAATAEANRHLAPYGLTLSSFAQLNVNVPDADAEQLKQFAASRAYAGLAGSFDAGVRAQATLEIAQGVAEGNVGSQPAIVAGMMMGVPAAAPPAGPAPTQSAPPSPTPAPPGTSPAAAPVAGTGPHFCSQCGTALEPGAHFCPNCGAALGAAGGPA